ncbi:SOUL family heme-binding protein [Paeniroseomonas aquatica]|uniref:Heme-binding protein n=1 Tax=Paeniroseomonas aquatica TaxID=373043 RepID=A0ABT8AFE4_9PROT|nr:heme-binding protein [Paeniroseomonas aquatica]MDN3568201.1 heme-binding protein [Paeniroseomonas aquatica]
MLPRLLSAATALLLGACSVIGVRSGTEEPRFEVLDRQGPLEIRRYASRLAAETLVAADSEEAARREGFRRLAGYIFGANRGQARIAMTAPVAQAPERIAMTAPVAAAATADGWTIRFYMPARFTREALPIPDDPRVTIAEVPAETLAVLRYAGLPGAAAAARQRAALLAALATGPWQAAGEPFDWFYDPPWTLPPARRNEAVVAVTPRRP